MNRKRRGHVVQETCHGAGYTEDRCSMKIKKKLSARKFVFKLFRVDGIGEMFLCRKGQFAAAIDRDGASWRWSVEKYDWIKEVVVRDKTSGDVVGGLRETIVGMADGSARSKQSARRRVCRAIQRMESGVP